MDSLNQLLEKDKIITVCTLLFNHTHAPLHARRRRSADTIFDALAPEVLFDMTSMAGGEPVAMTPQAITDAWEQGLKPLQAIHHQVGNFIVNIITNEAEVFCYGTASHYLPNPSNDNTRIFVGSYDFHLQKSADDWLIDKFKFNLKYIDGNEALTD